MQKKPNPNIRLSLELSMDVYDVLAGMAYSSRTSKGAVLRKAIELIRIASEAKLNGQSVGIIDKKKRLVSEITGI